MSDLPILNVAAYKFVPLSELGTRRRRLQERTRAGHLRGTILLAEEGINLFLAGRDDSVEDLLEVLQSDPEIGVLDVKRSRSADIPFRRMLVKIKREIISFDVPGIDPVGAPAPKLAAQELSKWLSEGRDVCLLDVRNDYEVEVGTFAGATPIGVNHFRDFPAAASKLPASLKKKPVVMFCTGGIRCEKAGPMMQQAGFENVLQLEGGILKYFEECGDAHYDGDCFVFDQRVALAPDLSETEATLCFGCQAVLSKRDQLSPKYVPPHTCPHCYRPPDVELQDRVARRRQRIAEVSTPLPGKTPYENRRPLNVPERHDGARAVQVLATMHPHVDEVEWRRWFDAGLIVRGEAPLTAESIVRAGERIERIEAETVEPDVNADIQILFEDAMLVVVNKPAPLPMHPSGRFNRNTLSYILDLAYAPQRLRIAHRLDAHTTGVAVLSRTKNVARRVQPQFERGQVQKHYVARVHGWPTMGPFDCVAPIERASGKLGARRVGAGGQHARTEFECLAQLEDGTALVAAKPITGRTNQIRLHLAHLGFPILGDTLYGAPDPAELAGAMAGAPLCLHAHQLGLLHPEDRREIRFVAPLPRWADGAILAG